MSRNKRKNNPVKSQQRQFMYSDMKDIKTSEEFHLKSPSNKFRSIWSRNLLILYLLMNICAVIKIKSP